MNFITHMTGCGRTVVLSAAKDLGRGRFDLGKVSTSPLPGPSMEPVLTGRSVRGGIIGPGSSFRRLLVVVAALALVASLAVPAAALAQDEFEVRPKFDDQVGPFKVVFITTPFFTAVGQTHFTVKIREAATDEPVDGAIVKIRADHDEEESIEVRALNTPDDEESYKANMTLMEPGGWTFVIDVDKEGLEPISLEVPVLVAEPALPAGEAGTFVWILVFVALIGGVLFLWNKSRKTGETDSIVRHR